MAAPNRDPTPKPRLVPKQPPGEADGTAGLLAGARGWLDDRLGLSALRYRVPVHANTFSYTLGGITFVGVVVLALTGVWLAQYYNPDPTAARESVLYIANVAPLGDVIRGVHVWTAYLVVLTVTLHLARIFVTASYKVPREINWLVGLGLLGLLLFGGVFTGTILRWDQEAYEAVVHNMELAGVLGAFGGFFAKGFAASVGMLPRLYIAHVSIVPLILVLLLVVHFFMIKHHGISPTPAQADAGEAPDGRLRYTKETGHYPTHLRLMVGYGLALVGLAGTLGVILPQAVGPAPNPTIEVTKPPFVFFWLYPFEDWFGVRGILYATIAVFGLLAALPFVDRAMPRALRRRRLIAALGVILLAVVVGLSLLTAVAPAAQHLG
ncbi:MAG: cytochrome b N-terminal domain-containing protein [Chloroflexota bacterium]